jgi:hypothetical protein
VTVEGGTQRQRQKYLSTIVLPCFDKELFSIWKAHESRVTRLSSRNAVRPIVRKWYVSRGYRWRMNNSAFVSCIAFVTILKLPANPHNPTPLTYADIRGFVLTSVLPRPIFSLFYCVFTYEVRRGRESNPRIAVLQTATLPLGYPASCARADNIVVAALVSSAEGR